MKLKRKTQSDRLECQIMLRVRHPNIIELYDRYFNYNSEFIMMELAEFDLRQLRERKDNFHLFYY